MHGDLRPVGRHRQALGKVTRGHNDVLKEAQSMKWLPVVSRGAQNRILRVGDRDVDLLSVAE